MAGSGGDFQQVFEAHYDRVYRFCLALCKSAALAEELTQQTFFQALHHIDGFRVDCRLDVWLCQIAKHEFYAVNRRQRRYQSMDVLESFIAGPTPESAVERREETLRAHAALHQLEEPYKEVFSLRVFGELPYLDIARLFGKTESWARVTYYRAKLKMVDLLKDQS